MKAVIQTAGAAGSKALGQSRAAALGEQRNDLRSQQEQHGSREHATGERLEREAGWGVSCLPGLVSLDLI